MNILIPPIVNMPRVCDECPEDLCLIGYTALPESVLRF